MTRRQKRQRPAGTGRVVENMNALYAPEATPTRRGWQSPRLPRDWRERLERADVEAYYRRHVEKLSRPNATGWAQGRCPFHEDRSASLSVHVTDARGGWRCFASCGGGDLIGFHQKVIGKPFADAVRDLLREVSA